MLCRLSTVGVLRGSSKMKQTWKTASPKTVCSPLSFVTINHYNYDYSLQSTSAG